MGSTGDESRVQSAPTPAHPPTTPAPRIARQGRVLVIDRNAPLPPRCVKCNAEVGDHQRVKRKLHWHHPAIYLTILPGLLIYVIIATVVRQTAVVHLGVCPRHRRLRWMHIGIAWLVAIAGFGCIALAIRFESGVYGGAAIVCIFGSLIYAAITVPVVVPKRIDPTTVWLKRCGPEYLAQFPESGG